MSDNLRYGPKLAKQPHKWRQAPRSLFSTFMCSVCGATSMVKHRGRCSGGS